MRQTLEETFGPDALSCDGRLPFRADAKRALELALREAVELGRRKIGTNELLLGLLREPSRASELLARLRRRRVRRSTNGYANRTTRLAALLR